MPAAKPITFGFSGAGAGACAVAEPALEAAPLDVLVAALCCGAVLPEFFAALLTKPHMTSSTITPATAKGHFLLFLVVAGTDAGGGVGFAS
jgi:hypothetical protein